MTDTQHGPTVPAVLRHHGNTLVNTLAANFVVCSFAHLTASYNTIT